MQKHQEPFKKQSDRSVIIALVIVLLMVLLGFALYFLYIYDQSNKNLKQQLLAYQELLSDIETEKSSTEYQAKRGPA